MNTMMASYLVPYPAVNLLKITVEGVAKK